MKKKKLKPIPRFKSEAEERRFWESRDSTDYVDWRAAELVALKRDKIELPAADWDAFHNALVDPPAPTARLRKAVRRYRKRVGR